MHNINVMLINSCQCHINEIKLNVALILVVKPHTQESMALQPVQSTSSSTQLSLQSSSTQLSHGGAKRRLTTENDYMLSFAVASTMHILSNDSQLCNRGATKYPIFLPSYQNK